MRRDGELVPCTWDDALDDIAARIAALVAEHGPEVIADYTGTGGPLDPSGYALAEGLMRNLGSHQRYSALSIDCPAKFLVPQLMAGVQLQFQPDLDRAELLLAIGVNTVVSHGHGVMVPNPLGHLRDVRRPRRARRRRRPPALRRRARHADLHVAPGRAPTRSSSPTSSVRRSGRAATSSSCRACADAAASRRLAVAVEPFDADDHGGDRRRAGRRPAGPRRARGRGRTGRHRDRHRRDDEPQRQPHASGWCGRWPPSPAASTAAAG